MGGAAMMSGFVFVGAGEVGLPLLLLDGRKGIRQYVPPKCIVRRLRSVRQVHFEGSSRKARMTASSLGVMKFSRRARPGTDVKLGEEEAGGLGGAGLLRG